MVQQNYLNNQNIVVKSQLGGMQVLEYAKDMSVSPHTSKTEFYCAQMNINKRQVLLNLNGNGYTVQSGAMQWMSGNVNMTSGVKGAGDLVGKFFASKVTGESTIKPEYVGNGQMMLEPTYRHILLTDVSSWGGTIVLDDGLFLACDNTLQQKVVARSNVSSAIFGKEGLFNLSLIGQGVVALESVVPMEEIIEINLQDDTLKIDGNMAIAWSGSLEFTVEKSGKSLLGSAVSGEGLVNVYRGTGKVWMAPVTTAYEAGTFSPTENVDTQSGSSNTNVNKKVDKVELMSSIVDNIFS